MVLHQIFPKLSLLLSDHSNLITNLTAFSPGLLNELGFATLIDSPEAALARLFLAAWDFDEISIQTEIMTD